MIHSLDHINRIEKGNASIFVNCSCGACHSERREALCWHVSLSISIICNTLIVIIINVIIIVKLVIIVIELPTIILSAS